MKTKGNFNTACFNNYRIESNRYLSADCITQPASETWLESEIKITEVFAYHTKKAEFGIDYHQVSETCKINGTTLECSRNEVHVLM